MDWLIETRPEVPPALPTSFSDKLGSGGYVGLGQDFDACPAEWWRVASSFMQKGTGLPIAHSKGRSSPKNLYSSSVSCIWQCLEMRSFIWARQTKHR